MKNTITLLSALILSISAQARTDLDLNLPENLKYKKRYPEYRFIVWHDFVEGETLSMFSLVNETIIKSYAALIGHNNGGIQGVHIMLPNSCNYGQEQAAIEILKTNEKNVRYKRYCQDNTELLRPKTAAGMEYLINEFKNKKFVNIEIDKTLIPFNARGFTKAWDDLGGNAI